MLKQFHDIFNFKSANKLKLQKITKLILQKPEFKKFIQEKYEMKSL